jgi:hypothetical protein
MAIQQNNGGPVGYGQPGKGMRRRLMRPEDEAMFGQQSPEVEDVRQDSSLGQGQPPQVYPQQPPGIPSGWQRSAVMPRDPNQPWGQPDLPDMPGQGSQFGNYGMPGRTPMKGAGENQYSQQPYQTRTDDPFVAGIRNQMATPMGAQGGVPPAWTSRNGGFNPYANQQRPQLDDQQDSQAAWDREYANLPPGQFMNRQRPGTEGSVDPRVAPPSSGYGYGGVQNPAYQNAQANAPLPGPQPGGDLAAATRQSMQNGYTDIAGMRDYFKPGQFMGQLEGFNTNSWGTGERGSDTLKNMFGTIASNHDVSQPGALQRALVDIQKALPNASIVSHANEDLLDPDGPNGPMQPVDVIRGATAGGAGAAWQWGPLDQQGQGASMGGPQGPSNQMYNQALTQMTPQAGGVGPDGAPEVQDPNSAMQFLQWLMQQQQQGQIGQQPSTPFV